MEQLRLRSLATGDIGNGKQEDFIVSTISNPRHGFETIVFSTNKSGWESEPLIQFNYKSGDEATRYHEHIVRKIRSDKFRIEEL